MNLHAKIMASGTLFDFAAPTRAMIRFDDLVHHLSREGALGGNIQFASYSIAQHALVMASAVRLPASRPYALLEHAPRAYLGGMVAGLQFWLVARRADVTALERQILFHAILPAFNLPRPSREIMADVDYASEVTNATELRDVVAGRHPDWAATGKPLATVIRFKPQPKIEDEYRAALDRELRPFKSRAVA